MADVDVDDYGSTHDEELAVPLTLMDHNRTNTKHPSSNLSWNTKKLMFAGIIGMTAAVTSSALLFLSIVDFSEQASTESFLLHQPDGVCVVASGPWPPGVSNGIDDDTQDHPASRFFAYHSNGIDDDTQDHLASGIAHPFETCFSTKINSGYAQSQCWTKSYSDGSDNWIDGYESNWKTCKPKDFGSVWIYSSPTKVSGGQAVCGTPCTTFD